ncbi:uncharacterized protein KNAG_0B00280 [Huiozyma naganishii CBS 8797]|uniref:Gal80p-like C-terminal domain-containing protein n=1 Tax=Huiozyma naganishii (strain ATCC MYA-139 / BCRC 22969 / CBS 8797 / KCTC 17520 / NBRC 10181 / NCYC 3082 / Yp74L-3) TaxID=1071383 RepID=J7RUI9_HUIN7|nr:hypothetical protein KNAG_0B00280 [Kazachstania naganishii CBS 8797]CCK68477.1 hypothetical protein KNAG_0B00280 [Kazachstania naganishii CBS 8797]
MAKPSSSRCIYRSFEDAAAFMKVGIIGLTLQNSFAIKAHFPAIQQLSSHLRITALFNEDIGSSVDVIRHLKLEHATVFPTLKSFIASSNIDLLVVTLHERSYPLILADIIKYCKLCSEKDGKCTLKFIFLDWPLNCSVDFVKQMVEETTNLGIQTVVSLQGRKSPYVIKAKQLISEGSIGEINSMEIAANGIWYGYERSIKFESYLFQQESGVNIVTSSFAHIIDVVEYITGSYFGEINALLFNNIRKQELVDELGNKIGESVQKSLPDHLLFQGKLVSGNVPVSCTLRGGMPSKRFAKNFVIDIHGTKGDVKLEGEAGFVEISNIVLYYRGIKHDTLSALRQFNVHVPYDANKEMMEFYHLRKYNALLGNILKLYQSVLELHAEQQKNPHVPVLTVQSFGIQGFPTLSDGLLLYKLLAAVYESSLSGRTMRVDSTI